MRRLIQKLLAKSKPEAGKVANTRALSDAEMAHIKGGRIVVFGAFDGNGRRRRRLSPPPTSSAL